MDKRVIAIVCVAAAICALLIAHSLAAGNAVCIEPWNKSAPPIGLAPDLLKAMGVQVGVDCQTPRLILGSELAATILAAIAASALLTKRQP